MSDSLNPDQYSTCYVVIVFKQALYARISPARYCGLELRIEAIILDSNQYKNANAHAHVHAMRNYSTEGSCSHSQDSNFERI